MSKKISVFIASPGDLLEERKEIRSVIEVLNSSFSERENVKFEAEGWEDCFSSTGVRNQSIINTKIDSCDVFILIMNRRWGQDAPDSKPYSSYTEEEFHRALELWKKFKKPEIFVFFKRVDAESEGDPGPQLKKVMKFRRQLENSKQVLYRYFDDTKSLANDVDSHLRSFVLGDLPQCNAVDDSIILPLDAIEKVKNAETIARKKIKEAEISKNIIKEQQARLDLIQIEMAIDASYLSQQGQVEFARQKFAKLSSSTIPQVLFLCSQFYALTGDLHSNMTTLSKFIEALGPEEFTLEKGAAFGSLGNLYYLQGNYKNAKIMYLKALKIHIKLDDKIGCAGAYGGLGLLSFAQGDFSQAESYYHKSLHINEELGNYDGIACRYNNLGSLYRNTGNLNLAEDMYQKSLLIYQKIGKKDGVISNLANIGNIHSQKGNKTSAEEKYKEALDLATQLEMKPVIANLQKSLGTLLFENGDIEKAKIFYEKSLYLNEEIGLRAGIAGNYSDLGIIYSTLNDYRLADEMFSKSLAIYENLNSKAELASLYINIGVNKNRIGELAQGLEYFEKSKLICVELGLKECLSSVYGNIGDVHCSLKDYHEAKKYYQDALALSTEVGDHNLVALQTCNLADIIRELGDYEVACQLADKSIQLFEKSGIKPGLAEAYAIKGNVFKSQKLYDQAEEMYNRSINIFREINSPKEKSLIYVLNDLLIAKSLSNW